LWAKPLPHNPSGDPEGGKFISDQANKFGGAEGKRDFFSEDILMYF